VRGPVRTNGALGAGGVNARHLGGHDRFRFQDGSGAEDSRLLGQPGGENQPPVAAATATPDPVSSPTTVITLNGTTSSDPDGSIVSYQWELVSGPSGGTFSNSTASTTTFTPTP
jgi:hypothetical protein